MKILGQTGIYAGLDVHPEFSPPANDILYAPTVRPGDPSCLEESVAYFPGNRFVGFYSFCGSASLSNDGNDGYYVAKSFGDPDFNEYTTQYMGHQIVSLEIYFGKDQAWHGLIYHYSTQQWVEIMKVGGSCNVNPSTNAFSRSDSPGGCLLYPNGGDDGWAIFETHYHAVGQSCPATPDIRVYAVQTRNSHGVFQTIVPPWWNNILQSGDCSGLTSSSGIYDHFTVGTNAISSYAWSVQGE